MRSIGCSIKLALLLAQTASKTTNEAQSAPLATAGLSLSAQFEPAALDRRSAKANQSCVTAITTTMVKGELDVLRIKTPRPTAP